MASFAFEKHYRVKELAGIWGLSPKTVTRIFAGEPGVIRVANGNGKRKYATLSIPESVALRVHERLGNQAPEAALATGHALRVIRLGEHEGRAPKKKRNVIKVRPAGNIIDLGSQPGPSQPSRTASTGHTHPSAPQRSN